MFAHHHLENVYLLKTSLYNCADLEIVPFNWKDYPLEGLYVISEAVIVDII